jgi:hypothetical protein
LADALERAVAAISEGKSPVRSRAARPTDYLEAELSDRPAPRRGKVAVRKYTPENISSLRAFIEYCRAGSFRIF